MAMFDVNNPPAMPDSNLDPDLSLSVNYDIQGPKNVNIAPGDWVDVDESAIWPDPVWGLSFQVANCYPTAIGILVMVDPINDIYAESQLSLSWIQNNFRRVSEN